MEIGIILGNFPGGGAEKQALRFAKHSSRQGNLTKLIAYQNGSNFEVDGVSVIGLDRKINFFEQSYVLRQFLRIREYQFLGNQLGNFNCDVFVVFNPCFLPMSWFKGDNRMVFFSRGFDKWALKFPFAQMIKKYDLVASNNFPGYSAFKNYGISCEFIPNIVFEDPSEIVRDFPIVKNKRYLLVSNISKIKNIGLAIDAFEILAPDGFRLAIAGKLNGPFAERLFEKTRRLPFVDYLGYLSEEQLREEYAKSEGVIHPSSREGTPNAILEAIKYGKPVIASHIPEHAYLLGDRPEILFDPHNPKEAAMKLQTLHNEISLNSSKIREGIRYLQDRLEESYSPENASTFLTLLQKLSFNC